jgi:DNA-binding protein HU-beta
MNKTQLVDALAARIGDRRTAATAVDGLLDTIVEAVGAGESVSITGFGVFEPRARAARNPRTGEAVQVAATTVPGRKAGTGFRSAVGGAAVRARAGEVPAQEAPAAPGRRKAAKGKAFAPEAVPEAPKQAKAARNGEAVRSVKAAESGKASQTGKAAKAAKDGAKDGAKDAKGKKGKAKK